MILFKALVAFGGMAIRVIATQADGAIGGETENFNLPPQSIIGGTEITPHSRPYLVSLGDGPSSYKNHTCGGSLISPHAVLTAAHCVFSYPNVFDWDPPKWVEFNRHNLIDDTTGFRVDLTDTSQFYGDVIYHPRYIPHTWDYDVAILFLPQAIMNITPVTLNEDPKVPVLNAPLDVSGWGTTETVSRPEVPLAVTVNYITNQVCTKEPFLYKDNQITKQMMCAAAPGKDSCFGDSGGPLVLGEQGPSGGIQNPVVQVGIVSWGSEECADKNYPGVYTRVSVVANFVKSTVCGRTGELCNSSKAGKHGKK